MEYFLKTVAKDLYKQFGNDLSHVAVVFPNKRASLFFNEYLADEAKKAIWSPAYLSISELFCQSSNTKLGDSVKLVCELYKTFCKETKSKETLDDFYFWGELLISDFDDIDKNLVDANRLFSNLQDLKGIMDDYEFLDKEQEEAIQQFFQNFSIEHRTVLKERFISLWNVLGNIYTNYKETLSQQGIAYEGMLYRSMIEQIQIDKLPYNKYVFVGFNVLNKVESKLFQVLRDANKALFYWDYDTFYLNNANHEAGEFIKRNLHEFPSSLSAELFNTLSKPKNIRYIAASTENAQARFLPTWIKETHMERESESAVVLCNEALLLPVLHCIPSSIENVNITMGFPLSQTPICSFINALLDMQTIGYNPTSGRYTYATVIAALKHPYTRQLSKESELLERSLTQSNRFYPLPSELKKDDFLSFLFTPQLSNLNLCEYLIEVVKTVAQVYQKGTNSANDVLNQLYRESLFKVYTTISRFKTLIEASDLIVGVNTFRKLLDKVLTSSNIPFHGEPAIGMQIMGVLETRNLDFKNLLLLSLNEGQLPKAGGDSSFIPYNLRKAFGMTTIEHKNAVYAYYFYRLMQRAENITLLYNTSTDGLNRGEWSRFMLQFLIEYPHTISREYLDSGQSPQKNNEIVMSKTTEVMKRLQNRFDIRVNSKAKFTPSALNTYIDCQLKFYFRYVAGLKPEEEVSSEIDSATFGSIFHRSAELVYSELSAISKLIKKEDIEQLLHNEARLQSFVDAAFKELFFKVAKDKKPEYNGIQLINSNVITSYLKQLLTKDLLYTPFSMEAMEKEVTEDIEIQTPKGIIKSRIGGIIDRMDSKGDILRIVDYKTGGTPKSLSTIDSLLEPSENRPNYIFQTFVYAAIMSRKQSLKVSPALLYIHRATADNYSPVIEIGEPRQPKLPIDDFSQYEEEFRELLNKLLEEIFDPEEKFAQTDIAKSCEYCDFKTLCNR